MTIKIMMAIKIMKKAIFMKKAIYFSIDALIAANIILLGALLASSFYVSEHTATAISYLPIDILNVLGELKINEVENALVDSLVMSGNITRLNNSILEQIGEFWAEGKPDIAKNLTREFTEPFLDHDFSLLIDNEVIYSNITLQGKNLLTAKRMISGIRQNRTREGFLARATASKIRKNTTAVFTFESEGSGNEAGADKRVELTKKFNIDATSIYEAALYLAIHYGTAVMNPQTEFIVNGISLDKDDINWSYLDYDKDNTHLAYGQVDISSYAVPGWNTITLILFGQSAHHTHLHPGGKIVVSYENEKIRNVSQAINKKTYFDHIVSKGKESNGKSGAWAIMPLFVPKNVALKKALLHLKGISISNDNGKDNVQIYLNSNPIALTDPSADGTFDQAYDLAAVVGEGTNVISVYLNAYPDDFWGDGDTILYSDPQNDAQGSSYIEVEYEFNADDPRLIYGKIDVSLEEKFGGEKSHNLSHSKDFTNMEVFETFIQPAQLDSRNVSVFLNGQPIFNTPRPLAVPSSIYGDATLLASALNAFTITDYCLDCDVLPQSSLYYTIYVPSLVGYGATFDNKADAIDDAKARLAALLGSQVTAVEINDEVLTIGKVPSMWGPAIVEVRVWQ